MKISQHPEGKPFVHKLLQSLNEALAYARGNAPPERFRTHVIAHTETLQPTPASQNSA
jgi:hypothetical protein